MAEGNVYNVRINSDLARLVDEKQVILGTTTAVNEGDEEAQMTLTIAAVYTTALTISSGSPGVIVHFNSSAAEVTIGSVVVGIPAINETLVWGETKQWSTNTTVTVTVVVPKKSRVTSTYGGTQGTFSIPFSYTLEDKNITTEHSDGVYTVVQNYDFNFKNEIEPL